jgi:hypothetical protein
LSAIHELFDASKRRRDPTGTISLQIKFFGEAGVRMARAKLTIRRAVAENDLLGLADGPMRHHAPAVRLQAFGHMVENAVSGMRGVWPQRFLQRAWAMGLEVAAREGFAGGVGEDELSALSQAAQHELVGIVAATVQRVTRAGASVKRGTRPMIAARRILNEFDKIAFNRVQALVAYFVVKTYNRAKLEAYRAGGLTQVGIEPEFHRKKITSDAFNPDEPRNEKGEWATGGSAKSSYQEIAKESLGKNSLTAKERAAVDEYIDYQQFEGINKNLREGGYSISGSLANLSSDEKELVDDLTSAINKSKLSEEIVLYRGVAEFENDFGETIGKDLLDNLRDAEPGDEFLDYGFQSTSTGAGAARDFGEGTGKSGAMLVITAPKGTPALLLSGSYHSEVLLQRGTRMILYSKNGNQFHLKITGIKKPRGVKDAADTVGVLTAGDDLVCQECEDYADDAPYEIDDVELPLHPRCRCAVFPWTDKRFAGAGGAELGE